MSQSTQLVFRTEQPKLGRGCLLLSLIPMAGVALIGIVNVFWFETGTDDRIMAANLWLICGGIVALLLLVSYIVLRLQHIRTRVTLSDESVTLVKDNVMTTMHYDEIKTVL